MSTAEDGEGKRIRKPKEHRHAVASEATLREYEERIAAIEPIHAGNGPLPHDALEAIRGRLRGISGKDGF